MSLVLFLWSSVISVSFASCISRQRSRQRKKAPGVRQIKTDSVTGDSQIFSLVLLCASQAWDVGPRIYGGIKKRHK
jgi:hypothetical protein